MGQNVIKRDFRASEMVAESHFFVKKKSKKLCIGHFVKVMFGHLISYMADSDP